MRRGRNVLVLEHSGLVPECPAIDRIPITDEETGGIVSPAGLPELPACPCRGRMYCDIDMLDTPMIITQDDQHE